MNLVRSTQNDIFSRVDFKNAQNIIFQWDNHNIQYNTKEISCFVRDKYWQGTWAKRDSVIFGEKPLSWHSVDGRWIRIFVCDNFVFTLSLKKRIFLSEWDPFFLFFLLLLLLSRLLLLLLLYNYRQLFRYSRNWNIKSKE